MTLSIFLAIGESWEEFEKIGQDKLLINNNYHYYSQNFEKVNIFSYGKKSAKLLPNVYLKGNRYGLNRFIYSLFLPIIYSKEIKDSNILRGMQLTGAIPAMTAKLIFRKKFVFNYGYNYIEYSRLDNKPIQAVILTLLKNIITKFADKIIVTTSDLAQNLPRKKTVVIPNSIDTDKFKAFRTNKDIDILFVGRLEKQKNLQFLLDAISLTSQKIKVIFVGSGIEKVQLINKAKHLKINFQLFSNIAHDKLPKLYNRARVFILPSLIEGHPKALLEAMSCGLPVIGTNVNGINNLIKHNETGLLIEQNPNSLARAIIKILNSLQCRKKLGKAARKYILDNYESRKIWIKEISLLKSVV